MTDITLEQRAALLRYGRHEADCDTRHDSAFKPKPRCTCGFEAALRLSAGAGWQPIETAPDEVPADDAVIVCITHDEPRFAGKRMAGEAYKVDGVWWWAGSHPNDYHSDPIEDMYGLGCVTHWQPLPATPRHETGEGLRGSRGYVPGLR